MLLKGHLTEGTPSKYKWIYVWDNLIFLVLVHIISVQGIYYTITTARWITLLYGTVLVCISSLGITTGAHRLWCHRSYKARLPLKIILALIHSMAFQKSIYDWVRDHRVHHEFVDTDADPHNATRGFFFSHMGWLMIRKHDEVLIKGRTVDLSDIRNDPIVMLQKKYHILASPILAFVVPALIPCYFFGEEFYVAWCTTCILRYVVSLHITFSVNSVAHIWGNKPYDKNIKPTDNIAVSLLAMGEGWHNYHHVFPWDYKAGEFGSYSTNFATGLIDLMAKIGWAYDRKVAAPSLILKRKIDTGVM